MSISEAILFIASNSSACMPCVQFVVQQHMPIQVVRLDTVQARKAAANGKFFQINSVPTMVIMYNDGNTQLFLGAPKIFQLLTAMKSGGKHEPSGHRNQEQQNMYGPISTAHPLGKTRRPVIDRGHDLPIPVDVEGDVDDYEMEMSDYPEPEPPRRVNRKPIVIDDGNDIEDNNEDASKPPKPKQKRRGKKMPVKVVEDEMDDEPESVAAKRKLAREKLNRAASAKSKPLSSRMKNVYSTAKQMEEERLDSLGYKEEDLPRY